MTAILCHAVRYAEPCCPSGAVLNMKQNAPRDRKEKSTLLSGIKEKLMVKVSFPLT